MQEEERRRCQMMVVQLETQMKNVGEDIHEMKDDIHTLREYFDKYVSKVEFFPVKVLVYGAAGLILSGVFAALIALVVAMP